MTEEGASLRPLSCTSTCTCVKDRDAGARFYVALVLEAGMAQNNFFDIFEDAAFEDARAAHDQLFNDQTCSSATTASYKYSFRRARRRRVSPTGQPRWARPRSPAT